MKTCKKCGSKKPSSEFPRYRQNKSDKWRLRKTCKVCFAGVTSKWTADNKTRAKEYQRDYKREKRKDPAFVIKERCSHLKSCYNMTFEDEHEALLKQKGLCAVCGESLGAYHIDHCHTTGEFRGILCASCNILVGKYETELRQIHAIPVELIKNYLRR